MIFKTFDEKPPYHAGPVIRCPLCRRVFCEAEVKSMLRRCDKCKKWVLALEEDE